MSTEKDARDAATGRYVSEEYAAEHPDTTVVEMGTSHERAVGADTRPKLADIEARAEGATEGPWGEHDSWAGPGAVVDPTGHPIAVCGVDSPETGYLLASTDRTFIAHARTDVPALLAAVHAVRRLATEITPEMEALADAESFRALWVNLRGDVRAALSAHLDLEAS